MIDKTTGLLRSDLVKERDCPVCQSGECSDVFTKEGFLHSRCNNCSMVYVRNPMTDDACARVYDGEYHTEVWQQKRIDSAALRHKRKYFSSKASLLESYAIDRSLLDVGCGNGYLLREMQGRGWKTVGVELNKNARDFIRDEHGIRVVQFIEDLGDSRFGTVSFFQVLEHLADPKAVLERCWDLIKPGGTLVLAVPNINSLRIKVLHQDHRGFRGREHVNFFSKRTLQRLLSNTGFRAIRTKTEMVDVYGILTHFLPRARQGSKTSGDSAPHHEPKGQAGLAQQLSVAGFLLYKILTPAAGALVGSLGLGQNLVLVAKRESMGGKTGIA